MDKKTFYGREDGWELYDYLLPRLPDFYRHRVLFWDFIGMLAEGNRNIADELCSSDNLLKIWYKTFYNYTKAGESKPITICDIKVWDNDTDDISEQINDGDHDSEFQQLMGSDKGYVKVIKAWTEELMIPEYGKIR